MDKAVETQLKNIETRSGKTIDELFQMIRDSSLEKHGQLRDMLNTDLGMGHGDANLVVHLALKSDGGSAVEGSSMDAVVDEIYAGKHEPLRPVHDAVMKAIHTFGSFEIAPKKGYLSLRLKKQFAMVGPGTRGRLAIGLNIKGVEATDRLIAEKPGRVCQYQVFLTQPSEVDTELIDWIKTAYDAAS